jgi:hypothetical protein
MKPRATLAWTALLPAWMHNPVPGLPLAVGKEIREIVGPWALALVVAIVALAGAFAGEDEVAILATLLSGILMILMGAAVFGHEFSYRTVSLLLVQPVSRTALWKRKLMVLAIGVGSVLAVLLTGAAILAWNGGNRNAEGLLYVGLSGATGALLVAPWITLACRSTLAGAVFTAALPAVAFLVAFLAALARFGLGSTGMPEVQEFEIICMAVLLITTCLFSPFLAFRAFRRLEGLDGAGPALRLPRWSRASTQPNVPARAGSGWLRRTLGKELRLQTPSYVLTVLFVLASAAALGTRLAWPDVTDSLNWLEPLSALYVVTVALLLGALACAEDRQSGAMQWHLILPTSTARQWTVKCLVAIGLSLALTVGPVWLAAVVASAAGVPGWLGDNPSHLAAIAGNSLVLCCIGLYTSSMAPSGLRAVLWAVLPALSFELLLGTVLDSAGSRSSLANLLTPAGAGEEGILHSPANVAAIALTTTIAGGFLVVLLACAHGHYRRLDASAGRVLSHLGVLVTYVALGGTVLIAGLAVLHAVAPKPTPLPLSTQEPQIRSPGRPISTLSRCEGNLLTVGWASKQWSAHHSNALPTQLAMIVRDLARPDILLCPADTGHVAAIDWGSFALTNSSYDFLAPTGGVQTAPQVLARCPIHGLVVFADGSVSTEKPGANRQANGSFLPHNYRMARFGLLPAKSTGTTSQPPVNIRN